MAVSMWLLSKPMASMLAMASARWGPMARPEVSLPPAGASAECRGDGVAGAAGRVEEDWAGGAGVAAGVAAVLATGGAGVAGGAADDWAAGFSLGWCR